MIIKRDFRMNKLPTANLVIQKGDEQRRPVLRVGIDPRQLPVKELKKELLVTRSKDILIKRLDTALNKELYLRPLCRPHK